MALTGALFSGVSGLTANGNAMNIIGDNIANVNTVGFKASRAVFFDLLSAEVGGTKIGTGTRLAESQRLFTQGGVETTSRPTDLAIQGGGLFVLKDAAGASFYSRAGQFSLDKDGVLVNVEGLKVQGFELDSSGNPVSGLTDIVIDSKRLSPPVLTSTIDLALNLDATSTVPATALPADAAATQALPSAWFAGSNFSTVATVYDSLGSAHDLTLVFRKTATANQWSYRVLADASEVTGGTAGDLMQVNAAGGLIAFNPDGSLNTGAPTNITAIGPIAWNDGASSQTIAAGSINLTGTTQFSLASAVSQISQNGSPSGAVSSISIDTNGVVTGFFSSGLVEPLYRIALADFASPEGLTHLGKTLFQQSADSGAPIFGNPGDGGLGTILPGSLELSNVDLATEFVKMVTTQRGFQASSHIITVTDSLLEEVANLKR
ncbi:MAG TPA: flagellar hook protein FlgE [Verrucomicrobiae bacterium]|jgi:flagellar hook protein FlgE|nr:flagellar hook protein FlgE [Verrucomicrobiae bacterium]